MPEKLLVCLALAGCAHVAVPSEPDSPRSALPRIELVAGSPDHADVVRLVPVDPRLPTVDRILPRVPFLVGNQATADVRVCVSPRGAVVFAQLAQASEIPQFDEAVMKDLRAWQFKAVPGPDGLRTCQRLKIRYTFS